MTEQPDFDDEDIRLADEAWDRIGAENSAPLKPIRSDKGGRLPIAADAARRLVGNAIRYLAQKFGHTYRPPGL